MRQMQQWPAKLLSSQIRTPKKLASKRFCGPSCMQHYASWEILPNDWRKNHKELPWTFKGPSVAGCWDEKVYDEWWPNQWLYNSTIPSFLQNPKTPLRKVLELFVSQEEYNPSWCPGVECDLLWTTSVAKGSDSGRFGMAKGWHGKLNPINSPWKDCLWEDFSWGWIC